MDNWQAPRIIDYSLDGRRLTYVDEQPLSTQLRQTLAERRSAGYPPVYRGDGPVDSASVQAIVAVIAALVTPFVIAGALGWSWFGWVLGLGAVIVLGLNAWRLNDARSPLALSSGDRREIAAATRYLLLDASDSNTPLPDGQSGDTSAAEVISVARALCDRIAGSPVWQSSYLDSHRVRLDLAGELDRIIQHAVHLHSVQQQLEHSITDDTPMAAAARRSLDYVRAPVGAGWESLIARVAALADYSSHLDSLAAELANADIAKRALGVETDVAQLFTSAVDDEQATARIRDLHDEARGITAAVNELLESLNADLHTLVALGTPGMPT